MKQNVKLFLLGLVTCLVLCTSLFYPSIFFKRQDETMSEIQYKQSDVQTNISPEADEIYLVKAISKIYNEDSFTEGTQETIENLELGISTNALAPLKNLEILNIDFNNSPLFSNDGLYYSQTLNHRTFNKQIKVTEFFLKDATSGKSLITFCKEEKTNKILFLKVPTKEHLFKNQTSIPTKYVQYLGLDILNDWKSDALGLISEKARLQIIFLNKNEFSFLAVAPIGYFNYERLEQFMEFQLIPKYE